MVAINAGVGWADMNDPLRDPGMALGSGSVHVKAPSGLRIISVTSDAPNNALFPNTSIVDVAQAFNVTVRVENTGGDDLDSVDVHLVSNGATQTAIVGDSLVSVPSKSEKDFVFSIVAASTPGSEILTSSIVYAVSVNTGERVYPGPGGGVDRESPHRASRASFVRHLGHGARGRSRRHALDRPDLRRHGGRRE